MHSFISYNSKCFLNRCWQIIISVCFQVSVDPKHTWWQFGGLVYDVEYASQFLHSHVAPLPFRHITLLKNESGVQLYLDYTHISNVYVDDIDYPSLVTWTDSVTSGTIELVLGGKNAYGTFGTHQSETPFYALSLQLKPISYIVSMSTSDECGAYKVSEVGNTNLKWNETSAQWQSAKWVPNQLNFTYGLRGSIMMGIKMWDVEVHFGDLLNGNHWDPILKTFSALLNYDFLFDFDIRADMHTPNETRNSPDGINYIYPYKMSFKFNAVADHFDGAILTNDSGAQGIVYGIQGDVNYQNIVGSYHVRMLDHTTATIGMAGGKLYINGECVDSSRQEGDTVIWQLPESQLSYTNIPREGYAVFSKHGDRILHGTGISSGERVAHSHSENHESQYGSTLNFQDLLGMSQYVLTNGSYEDEVQMKSTNDLMMILQFYMDPQLRQDYISENPPDLDPTVRSIASIPGKNGTDPQTFYRELSIAYITSSLSGTDDPYAKTLNAKRASAWLKSKVGRSDVYQAQSPELYQHRYLLKINEMEDFREDQKDNAAQYVNNIKAYEQQWIHNLTTELENKTMIAEMTAMMANLTVRAVNGQFWAYLYFAYVTQPSALMMMQTISMSPNYGGSAYARRVQENCAVLTALDQESVFVRQYVNIMQSFQITNMIPTLLDYNGNSNNFNYAANEILNNFINKYANDPDPEVVQHVKELKAAMASGQVSSMMDALGSIAGSVTGVYGWEVIAERLVGMAGKKKWSMRALRLVGSVVSVCAFIGFIMGVKDWNSMTNLQRTQLVIGGITLGTEVFFSIIKRGVALKSIWNDVNIKWYRIDEMMGEKILIDASKKSATGFKRWLLSAEDAPVLATEGAEAAEAAESFSITKAVFGKNLQEFWATRVTAILSILNIILISYTLATGNMDEIEKAENAMFLMSACIDLVASIGSWIVTEGILVTIFGAMGPLAIAVAFIGAILMIVEMSKPRESPVQKFAEGEAKDAGFYMQYDSAIDYFQVYKIKSEPQRLRIAMFMPGESHCVNVGEDGALFISNFDYSGRSGFFLKTDSDGYATISTLIDDTQPPVSYQLVMHPDGRISGSNTNNNSYHLWVADMQADPTLEQGNLKSALFHLYNVGYWKAYGVKYYFSAGNSQIAGNPTPYTWQITMENLAPGKLNMTDIELYTFERDQGFHPFMLEVGSQPVSWSLSPNLPNFMQFNTSTGVLSQVTAMPPPVTNTTRYHLVVQNTFGTSMVDFNFNVTDKQF